MSTEAIGAAAPEATIVMDVEQPAVARTDKGTTGLHSPPDSNNAMNLDGSDSELSDIDEVADKLNRPLDTSMFVAPVSIEEPDDDANGKPAPPPAVDAPAAEPEPEPEVEVEDIGEILPDHFSGTVPVFRPTMLQFKDFKRFMEKVDKYGMKSGIVKIIPPQEWKDSLGPLDELVKQVRVREPIKQEIMGNNGTYRQVNFLHGRSYNLPQWRQLCEQSEHQPPARRGERRANAEKHKPATRSRAAAAPKNTSAATKKRKGRVTRGAAKAAKEEAADPEERPMTPVSPAPEKEEVVESVEQDPGQEDECDDDEDDEPVVRRMGFAFGRQSKPKTQSTSARRKYIRREGSARIDEEAFRDWDYNMDVSEFTPERCEELERIYWKTLTYAPPLYGADLPGTLFDESNETWNLNKLPNLLDVLGTKVPGVNTAYLYLGMWKATFAWHLEDVDLYSINYLHFGAPKQWYSISQADARRFETAMKNIWPTDAKACDQFLRHKAFLISPSHLKQHYNITVNKCVSYPGEFVVTYPYGYHSGYNLGYNCAEAVNFALDSWLPMGKIAKKCQCAQAQDSVWVDVYEIERKLRGEETEYEETEDEEDEEDDDDDHDTGLPSPPSSHTVRVKAPGRKRKRPANDQEGGKAKVKKIRLRVKTTVEPPCCLCPNDFPGAEFMPTDDGRKVHRMCALYLPETYIETVDDVEVVTNIGGIDKARLELKCLYCRSKKGACFQCSQKKCPRAYHATCAAAAGVFVEEAEVPVIGEDGTEYKEQAFEFSCRFHRTKRDKKHDGDYLEENPQVREAAAALKKNDICQIQYFRGDIFAGVVLENRLDEETVLLYTIPSGEEVEVEWKWLLLPDPADFRLPKASANAIPMPTSRKAQKELNAKRPVDDVPRKDDEFAAGFVWAEFHTRDTVKNTEQVKLDLFKDNQIWHYLGKTSTESKAQYTEDIQRPLHNLKSNFLDSIPKPPKPMAAPPPPKRSYSATHPSMAAPSKVSPVPLPPGVFALQQQQQQQLLQKQVERPYVYKPRKPADTGYNVSFTSQQFAPKVPQSGTTAYQQFQPPSHPQPQYPQFPTQFQQRPSLPPQPHQQHVHYPQQQPQPQQQYVQPQQVFQAPPHMQQQQPYRQYQQTPQQTPQTLYQQPGPPSQYQPFNKEPRQKNTSAYSSDRFAPAGGSNGFPQLSGLTWPPAHMKSGQHFQPPSRVWPTPTDAAAAAAGPPVPMTSGPRGSSFGQPQAGTGGKPEAGAPQKYTFFRVHHNRDPSQYRTPYGLWDGFTNGYEGNLRAFLIKAQRSLSGDKTPLKAIPPSLLQPLQPRPSPLPATSRSPSAGYNTPYSRLLPRPTSQSPQAPYSQPSLHSPAGGFPSGPPSFSSLVHNPSTPRSASCEIKQQPGLTPMRPQNTPSWQQNPGRGSQERVVSMSPLAPSPGPQQTQQPTPVSAPPKASTFTKQSHSPIPLPPYVKQVAAQAPKPSPLSHPPQQVDTRNEGSTAESAPAPQETMAESAPPSHSYSEQGVKAEPPSMPGVPQYQDPHQNHQYLPVWETMPACRYQVFPSQGHQPQAEPAAPSEPQQQFYWVPPYNPSQGHLSPATSGPRPDPMSSAPTQPQHQQQTYHYPDPVQPTMTAHSPSDGYGGPPPLPGVDPSDSAGLVQRMMMNLKRASQLGGST